jgi:molecular chaperone GrpE
MARPRPEQDAVREQMRERTIAEREGDVPAGAAEAPAGEDPAEEAPAPDAGNGGAPAAVTDVVDADAEEEPDALAEAERARDEYLGLAQRTQADFDNYRKRAAKDVAAASTRAKVSLAREILPAVDNLERALSAATEAEERLAEGVRLVHSELVAALARGGIDAFDPAGEPFDPVHHEALTVRSEEGTEAGIVLDVAEKGYRLGDTVLRPARVVVSA